MRPFAIVLTRQPSGKPLSGKDLEGAKLRWQGRRGGHRFGTAGIRLAAKTVIPPDTWSWALVLWFGRNEKDFLFCHDLVFRREYPSFQLFRLGANV